MNRSQTHGAGICTPVWTTQLMTVYTVYSPLKKESEKEEMNMKMKMIIAIVQDEDNQKAVSYTHLDVYKRQEQAEAAPGGKPVFEFLAVLGLAQRNGRQRQCDDEQPVKRDGFALKPMREDEL